MTSASANFAPLLLSVTQVASLLGCHPNTVCNRVRKDQMPKPIKWEGKTVWRRRDIEAFVDGLEDSVLG
jgi:predicted DNA-binding transcriptional regulator AlpA